MSIEITLVLPRVYDILYKSLINDNDERKAITIIKENKNEFLKDLLGIVFLWCAKKNNHKFLKNVIANIPEIQQNEEIKKNMIQILCSFSSYKCLKMLLSNGYKFHDSALVYVSFNECNWARKKKVIDLLLSLNCNKEYYDEKGFTPLIASIFIEDFQCVKYLLEKGCNPNTKLDKSTLMIAALKANKKIFQLLINNNANIFLKDNIGNNISHYTIKFNLKYFYEKKYVEKKIKFAKYMRRNNFFMKDKNNIGLDYIETYYVFIDEIIHLDLMNKDIENFSNIIKVSSNMSFSNLDVSQDYIIGNETEFIDEDYLSLQEKKNATDYFFDIRDISKTNNIIRLFHNKIFSDVISGKVKNNPYTLKEWPISQLKNIFRRFGNKILICKYKNKIYSIKEGKQGGKYIILDNNKKKYF